MTSNDINTSNAELSSFIHQAALDPHLPLESLNEICDASRHFSFSGLVTSLIRISAARKRLGKSQTTKLITVIGFPFGDIPHKIKSFQAEWAAEHGAEELELVPNFLAIHENKVEIFAEEIAEICNMGLPTRVILDAARLPQEKLAVAVEACIDAGVRGIQTGSGFGPKVSNPLIAELTALVKGRCSLKAVGGIKKIDQALELIAAGATEIGTSLGPDLMKELKNKNR
ncbi:deoxyribose-phosphate aldolase [Prochlorococcus marinus]|uniref:Putative deoxyribose-phosphate aldolase n=1 Tax=Prochlorococcus marinus (strain MIT 9211) TaxID=93059 RepID=A9BE18_PROM4|nr:deoxyribose-phosphate aldolase [Prochlorococcus marinus]ABX08328.1 Putative deoxyribose-phosphate aldolase [Prochlorococcus marinus str. MIT 9211]